MWRFVDQGGRCCSVPTFDCSVKLVLMEYCNSCHALFLSDKVVVGVDRWHVVFDDSRHHVFPIGSTITKQETTSCLWILQSNGALTLQRWQKHSAVHAQKIEWGALCLVSWSPIKQTHKQTKNTKHKQCDVTQVQSSWKTLLLGGRNHFPFQVWQKPKKSEKTISFVLVHPLFLMRYNNYWYLYSDCRQCR